ncbi:MAG: hypothetical protein IKN27_13215, partial [Selenomonadaceae bacterium]|nr:hypothetical protein [Selenomonadaceae bacterium]
LKSLSIITSRMPNKRRAAIEMAKRATNIEARVSSLEATFKAFMQEMRDFKTEMRDRDNQRAAEIMELRQKQDANTKEMDAKINRLGDKIQNIVIAAVVGFGAIMFAAVSALK